jgi:hypothetical protein
MCVFQTVYFQQYLKRCIVSQDPEETPIIWIHDYHLMEVREESKKINKILEGTATCRLCRKKKKLASRKSQANWSDFPQNQFFGVILGRLYVTFPSKIFFILFRQDVLDDKILSNDCCQYCQG